MFGGQQSEAGKPEPAQNAMDVDAVRSEGHSVTLWFIEQSFIGWESFINKCLRPGNLSLHAIQCTQKGCLTAFQ